MGIRGITQVPKTPQYVKRRNQSRGTVVPVIDLRLKFDLPKVEYTRPTCIIVDQFAREDAPGRPRPGSRIQRRRTEMHSQMTLGKKLMLGFGSIIAVALILGATSLNAIGKLANSFDTTVTKSVRKLVLADLINVASSDLLAAQRGVIVYGYAKNPAGIENAKQLFSSASTRYEKAIQEIRPLIENEEAKRVTGELESGLSTWQSVTAEVIRLAEAGDADGAMKVAAEKGLPVHAAVDRNSTRLAEIQTAVLAADDESARELNSRSRWTALGLLGLCLGIGSVVLFAVRQATQTLQTAASELGESAGQVASAAGQVSSSSQALAQGASEQAASIEETSASAEEITSMTRKNADNSRQAAEFMTEASRIVEEANRTLEQMVGSMHEINSSSDRIGKIIKTIDEIAFQTNILALNAAVEAARAGEAGMGFAVVADEVRNLAQRSAQAAKDTAGLIEESIAKSNEGSTKLDEVAAAIRGITESALKVRTLVDEVKLGSDEQARGIEQISKAITQMEQVTQKTAANAEEAASAGEEMSAQAVTLNDVVHNLTVLVGGGGNDSALRPRRSSRQIPPREHVARSGSERLNNRSSLRAAGLRDSGRVPVSAAVAQPGIPMDEDFTSF